MSKDHVCQGGTGGPRLNRGGDTGECCGRCLKEPIKQRRAMLTISTLRQNLQQIISGYEAFYKQFGVFQIALTRTDSSTLPYLQIRTEERAQLQDPEKGRQMAQAIIKTVRSLGAAQAFCIMERSGQPDIVKHCVYLGEAARNLEVGEEDVVLFSHERRSYQIFIPHLVKS